MRVVGYLFILAKQGQVSVLTSLIGWHGGGGHLSDRITWGRVSVIRWRGSISVRVLYIDYLNVRAFIIIIKLPSKWWALESTGNLYCKLYVVSLVALFLIRTRTRTCVLYKLQSMSMIILFRELSSESKDNIGRRYLSILLILKISQTCYSKPVLRCIIQCV